jgi:hypothetical protein
MIRTGASIRLDEPPQQSRSVSYIHTSTSSHTQHTSALPYASMSLHDSHDSLLSVYTCTYLATVPSATSASIHRWLVHCPSSVHTVCSSPASHPALILCITRQVLGVISGSSRTLVSTCALPRSSVIHPTGQVPEFQNELRSPSMTISGLVVGCVDDAS